MSLRSKLALIISSFLIFIYLATKTALSFDYVSISQSVEVFISLCFILLVFSFSVFIKEFIVKNKKGKAHGIYTRKLNECLISLTRNQIFFKGNLIESSKELTLKVAEYMCVDRVSIWLYNDDKSAINCFKLYVKSENTYYDTIELLRKDYYPYFNYINQDPIIVANDAEKHPATSCFLDTYLRPLGIKSMLDVPIYHDGIVIGVICLENLAVRQWISSEINFVQLLSSVFSFAYSVREINRINNDFVELENFVDTSVLISKADAIMGVKYASEKS